ncbi:Putative F-box protein At1g32420 [Linum grandiflorum]
MVDLVDDDLVVTEILSRLPVNSLMRFKSVCKPWKSTIEQDSYFINLHRIRSQARPRQLFTIVFHNREYNPGEPDQLFDFVLADLGCGDGVRAARVHNSWSMRVPYTDTEDVGLVPFAKTDVKGPVRELLCFVNLFNVRIYNVSTRQFVTPWIKSAISRSRYDKPVPSKTVEILLDSPQCEFGFDPDTGEYKVILVWHASFGTEGPAACEVLTVGVDNNWRVVDDVPPAASQREFIELNSTYANGSIYWMYKRYYDSVSLVAFDIGPEKFRMIMIPEALSMFPFELYPYMMELDGCLTVVRTRTPPTLELWKFHDRNKEGTLTYTSERGEDWSEVRIEMPSYIPDRVRVRLHPVHGQDQMMILETYERGDILLPMNMKFNCFYSYNGVNKTFNKFEIQGIHPFGDMDRTRCTVLEQDLLPAAEKKPAELRLASQFGSSNPIGYLENVSDCCNQSGTLPRPDMMLCVERRNQWCTIREDRSANRAAVNKATASAQIGARQKLVVFLPPHDFQQKNTEAEHIGLLGEHSGELVPFTRAEHFSDRPLCDFGFDPDTGEYKVILVWHASPGTEWPAACEVLTVGVDSNWRVVDDVPPAASSREFMESKGTYVNGSIYWMYKSIYGVLSFLAFDIGPEKFRTIMIPKFAPLVRSMISYELFPDIMELDGCITVVSIRTPPTLELWKFHDRNKEGTLTYTSGRGEDWSEVRIEIPSYIPERMRFRLHPVHEKDQMMILETNERAYMLLPMYMKRNCFYSYNGVNKTFNKFEIQGIHSLRDRDRTHCTVLEQDILPAAEKKPAELRLAR